MLEIPKTEEFDELCQFCHKPTGKKVEMANSHGTCLECLPAYKQELEDFIAERRAKQGVENKSE